MTQTTFRAVTAVPRLQAFYEPVADDLARVERLLREELRSEHSYVDELVRHGFLLGGKRMRPALLLLSAKAVGEVRDEHITLGAVIEMIHTATLVHDDVLDEASTRRHLATVNSRWDNEASVLLGDFLFTHAFHLASTLETTYGCRQIGNATNIVCEGELRQKGSRGNYAIGESAYLSILEAKTAELCACSCKLGAYYADAERSIVQHLEAFGRKLGIAFQIADDVLDVVGDESTTGKSLGTDLEKQKPTLPLIRVLDCASGRERQQLLQALDAEPAERLRVVSAYLQRYDAIGYSQQKARRLARQACRHLDVLPTNAAVDALRMVAEFSAMRAV
jgi:octaprenyl-diphosphate synthase